MPLKRKKSRKSKITSRSRNAIRIVSLVLLGFFVLLSPGQNVYTKYFDLNDSLHGILIDLPDPAAIPENINNIYPDQELTAHSVVIKDLDSGVYLYKKNELSMLSPASTTKIITALVALDYYNLDDVIRVKTVITNGQTMGLVPGEKITVENLLYGSLVHSGNDAAYALAENYPGGVEMFVEEMNKKAQDLYLTKSYFTNPIGFDDPNQMITAIDLARVSEIALNNPVIAKMVAIPSITISDVTHTYFHSLTNINQLLGKVPGVGGIKTGWTENAGENLATIVERDGRKVIIVVLKSMDRFADTQYLINWVYDNHVWRKVNPESI